LAAVAAAFPTLGEVLGRERRGAGHDYLYLVVHDFLDRRTGGFELRRQVKRSLIDNISLCSKPTGLKIPLDRESSGAESPFIERIFMPKKHSKKPIDAAALPVWRKARRSKRKGAIELAPGMLMLGAALRGTGFVQKPDPKDADYPMGAVAGEVDGDPRTKTQVWDLPSHLLNQGSTNSCVGHSCAHFILAAPIMNVSVDPIATWHKAQELDEIPGNEGTNGGTSVRAGFKALQSQDLITGDYRWASNAGDTLRFILNRGPVVIGSQWYPGMSQPQNGMLRLTGTPDPNMGHAYLLFGFSSDQDAFLVANSWGTSWGINGMGFLRYDSLDRLLNEGGVACSAIQD
jgi:hypothetical protein